MIYKIKIESNIEIYFDSSTNWIYFHNPLNFSFGFNVFNPFNYNSDNYNKFNYFIIEILKLYNDNKRNLFELHIKKCIENNNFVFCNFKGVSFTIEKTNLNLNDYEIIY